ncbi:MAG: DsbA family protein [Methylocystaceae bacterium]|nr:DsbA family protein [Methylocystaceae bacterium]
MRFFIALLSLCVLSFSIHAEETLNDTQQDEVRKLVRETLLKNPEIIMEAMQVLQAKQQEQQAKMQKIALADIRKNKLITAITPTGGNPKGDVTFVEFFDYQCGYCKRAFPGVMEVINSDKNIRYVFKEFAILGPASEIAARAALAAKKQGKYMDFHMAMMKVNGRLSEDKILKTAESVGLDIKKLQEDMKSDEVTEEIVSTREIAQRLDITGTPGFIIGDQIIPGAVPPETLVQAIKQQREKS